MRKVELLAPAGNMECLKSAVKNGADAVYLGGKKFGARHFAENFDEEEMISAIKYCHLYGVKLYVTVNTMIYEDEFEEALKYVEFLYLNNVDALIMQDIGLIKAVRSKYPNMEIHASTQFHNHNDEGLNYLKSLGIKRAVLARELSLDEIENFKTSIDKEVFIHGALCVSYSGCCLFSAMHNNRSGNRGECVGSCRLPYRLLENDRYVNTDGNYILSTKSLCTINNIDKLIDSGVTSLKIEGRMKSKEYVGYITKLYREKIDAYYRNKEYSVSYEEIKNIKKLYNRELTLGYIFDKESKELMNIKSSNHIGIHLGTVISIDSKYIKIKLDDDIYQEDGIRFDNEDGMIVNKLYNEKGLLVNKVEKGSIALVDNKINLKKSKEVRKTIDSYLNKEINSYNGKKIEVNFTCSIKVGKELTLSISDGVNTIQKTGNIVEESINCPTTYERVEEQIKKIKDTPFIASNIEIDMDNNVFVSIKELNELRRSVVDELISVRENISLYDKVINDYNVDLDHNKSKDLKISMLVRDEEQLKVAIKNKIDTIYTSDYDLYKKYKDNNVYYRTRRVNNNKTIYNNENLLVTEIGGIYNYSKNNNVNSDYYLNVANKSSIQELKRLGANIITLSVELSKDKISLFKDVSSIEVLIYGRVELMITKYCPMKMLINKDNKCSLCFKNKYALKDKDDNIYPIVTDNHLVHILDSRNIDLIDDIDNYLDNGIYNFRVELFDEKEKEIESIINEIRDSYEQRNNR